MKNNFKKLFLYTLAFTVLVLVSISTEKSSAENTSASNFPDYVQVGGNVIGIKLYTKGVHVVSTGYVNTADGRRSPAIKSGIKSGDFITKVNGKEVNTIEEFTSAIQVNTEIEIEYYRKERVYKTKIVPVLSSNDAVFKAGIWVRDSTAGIGTMTFYDPATGCFGALGHGINDSDTGKLMTLKDGKIYKAHLTSVTKGRSGSPGELNGTFIGEDNVIGSIVKNSSNGVFGILNSGVDNKLCKIGYKEDVHEGGAAIICCAEDDSPKEYGVKIINVIKNNPFNYEGITFKVTDNELLEKTDGILQGMSGSPIIQDGKIIGAVTHVFINNPTKGYGIFIENMLSEIYQNGKK